MRRKEKKEFNQSPHASRLTPHLTRGMTSQNPNRRAPALSLTRLLTGLLISGLLFVCQQPAHADTEIVSIEAIGMVTVQENNVAEARERAVDSALQIAFDQLVQTLLPSAILAREFETVVQAAYTHFNRFIQNYRVLAEVRTGNHYRVLVRADLQRRDIMHLLVAAGLYHGDWDMTLPDILIMTAELPAHDVLLRYWWHADLMLTGAQSDTLWRKHLTDLGFHVVGPEPGWLDDIPEELALLVESIRYQSKPDQTAVRALGKHFGAEVVLTGKTMLQAVPPLDPHSLEATADYQLIDVQTGELLATATPSLEAASQTPEATTDLLARMVEAGTRTLMSGLQHTRQAQAAVQPTEIEIILEGYRPLSASLEFRQQLSLVEGLSNIRIREMSTAQVVLQATYTHTSEELATALRKAVFPMIHLEIADVQPERLRIFLVEP